MREGRACTVKQCSNIAILQSLNVDRVLNVGRCYQVLDWQQNCHICCYLVHVCQSYSDVKW